MDKIKKNLRHCIQGTFMIITNSYGKGFMEGSIYQGGLKQVCLPGLNCYSCPGSLGACPIGALQSVLASRAFNISFYMMGFFLIVGGILGRLVCGFLCPFGFIQDLLYKIPFGQKKDIVKYDEIVKKTPYLILIIFVLILPVFLVDITGLGSPDFCKFICPSGTLMAGWPLALLNKGIAQTIGLLFAWKSLILIMIIGLSLIYFRPFCRYLCPLGAIYGMFNPISLYKLKVNKEKCIGCKGCEEQCKWKIPVYEKPNKAECIRCGECVKACPKNALEKSFF